MPLANSLYFAIAPSSDYKHQTSKSAPQLLRTLTSSPCIRSALKSWCKSYAHCTCFNTASCSVVSRAAAPADTPHGCLLTSNTTADASQPWRTAAGNRRVPDLRPCSRPQEGLHQGLRVELQSSRARQQGLLRGPMRGLLCPGRPQGNQRRKLGDVERSRRFPCRQRRPVRERLVRGRRGRLDLVRARRQHCGVRRRRTASDGHPTKVLAAQGATGRLVKFI